MYHKGIVMEVKEKYALVMAEDGQILRVFYKDGMKTGDCIYILEEDILKKDSFAKEKKQKVIWGKMTAAAAACVLLFASFAMLLKPEKAYAMVSVDGEKTVELVLNQKNRVKEAAPGSFFTREEERAIKGEKLETVRKYFSEDPVQEGTILVGYAFLEDESEEERAALQRCLERAFGTERLLCLEGDKEDVENAKKAGKSLGIYLAEQILAGESLPKAENEVTGEEILELLKKNPSFMENSAFKQTIGEIRSESEETEEPEESDPAEEEEEALEERESEEPEAEEEPEEALEETEAAEEPEEAFEETEQEETEPLEESEKPEED